MERTLVRAVLALESQELERITEQKQMLTKYSDGLAHLEPSLHTVSNFVKNYVYAALKIIGWYSTHIEYN